MKINHALKMMSFLLALMLGIVSCSSKPKVKEFPKGANAKEEITNLKLSLQESREQETDLLAPVAFGNAKESLKKAEKMERDGKDSEDILDEVALGNAYLDRAEEEREDVRKKIPDVLAARDSAKESDADRMFSGDFSDIDKRVRQQTALIEKDRDSDIKDKRAEFIASYMDLELRAIKKHHLGASQVLIDEAIRNGARDLAPKTLAATKKEFNDVDAFITQNRYDTPEIKDRAAELYDHAERLEATTASARGVAKLTPEQIAINMQAQEAKENEAQKALTEQEQKNQELAASNEKLTQEQKLQMIYEKARGQFSPEEAEVYKQGDKLVIRLKSLEFQTAEATIQGQNFAVLKKVEDVIGEFGKSNVIVQGHTDSTGGKMLNKRLSQERAMAVKQYLEVNAESKLTNFEAEGYGYERPLASNKTKQGRAQNRRVDVVIEPTQL